ncbi:MAG: FxLD family lanthipeptide [Mycobacteriales bacterium]
MNNHRPTAGSLLIADSFPSVRNSYSSKEPLDMDQHSTLNLDDFDLDIRVVQDDIPDDGLVACNTDDGCGSTCASACTNSGV